MVVQRTKPEVTAGLNKVHITSPPSPDRIRLFERCEVTGHRVEIAGVRGRDGLFGSAGRGTGHINDGIKCLGVA